MEIKTTDGLYYATDAADKLLELVDAHRACKFARNTNTALAYYDGYQTEETEKELQKTRQSWRRDGLRARTRNITKMIVEQSGQIIKDTPPVFSVFANSEDEEPDELLTQDFQDIIDKSGEMETWINNDEVTRLCKTTLILCQYDMTNECLIYDILHRGNSYVRWNPVDRSIDLLLYRLGEYTEETHCYYRLYLKDKIIDFRHDTSTNQISHIYEEDNTLGIVPASQFYDVKGPRTGFWVETPMDLVHLNSMYNLHITESEWVMSWMRRPTLFTNMSLATVSEDQASTYHDSEEVEFLQSPTGKLPSYYVGSDKLKTGPGSSIQLDGAGVDSPFVKYMAPDCNISVMDDVFAGWVKEYAADWSVRVDTAGSGNATSGFQLVVYELPNLELRRTRQKMLAAGFQRLFEIVKVVANKYTQYNFPEDSKLFVEFDQPFLPVDTKVQEEVWTVKLEKERASLVDYFRVTEGMTTKEALKKIEEIEEMNQLIDEIRGKEEEEPMPEGMVPFGQPMPEEEVMDPLIATEEEQVEEEA